MGIIWRILRFYANTDQSKPEGIKNHGDVSFPILVSHESITSYELNTFSWHWHPEIELTLIEEGEMMYQINGHEMHVQKGDLLFSNCNALHSGHSIDGRACYYWSITFVQN